jgi:hypothetical protein
MPKASGSDGRRVADCPCPREQTVGRERDSRDVEHRPALSRLDRAAPAPDMPLPWPHSLASLPGTSLSRAHPGLPRFGASFWALVLVSTRPRKSSERATRNASSIRNLRRKSNPNLAGRPSGSKSRRLAPATSALGRPRTQSVQKKSPRRGVGYPTWESITQRSSSTSHRGGRAGAALVAPAPGGRPHPARQRRHHAQQAQRHGLGEAVRLQGAHYVIDLPFLRIIAVSPDRDHPGKRAGSCRPPRSLGSSSG